MSPTHTSSAPRVRYEQATAMLASQVIVNSVEETMFLDCSSGFVMDDESGDPILPIHTRLAITASTARDLGELLISVADEIELEIGAEAGSESQPPDCGRDPAEAPAKESEDCGEGVYAPAPIVEPGSQAECEETLLEAISMHRKVADATKGLPRID